jgi:hypothetical protein
MDLVGVSLSLSLQAWRKQGAIRPEEHLGSRNVMDFKLPMLILDLISSTHSMQHLPTTLSRMCSLRNMQTALRYAGNQLPSQKARQRATPFNWGAGMVLAAPCVICVMLLTA